jgi:dihydroorotase
VGANGILTPVGGTRGGILPYMELLPAVAVKHGNVEHLKTCCNNVKRGCSVDFLFRNGRVIDPANNFDQIADVLVVNGVVADISPMLEVSAERLAGVEVIDASGKWVTPGLVDMHVHLREPGEEYKETIETGTRAAAAGGFTSVACMPNTRPVNDCAAVTEFILARAKEQGACRVLPVGAISKGLKGEGLTEFGELREAGAVAVTDDGRPVTSNQLMRRALEYAKVFDILVISHAEDLSLAEGGVMNEGFTSTLLGLRGIPNAAEEVMVARDLLLAELTHGRVHIAHVSTEGSVRMIREAKSRGVGVTAETAPHYFTLSDAELIDYDPVFKMNPPLRSRDDILAVKAGLADGTLDAIATDHAPHSVIEKDVEIEFAANGVIGLESALPLILGLVREGVLTPMEAIAKASSNPSSILGVSSGSLRRGAPADLTVIDPELRYILDANAFYSKSRNCPFHGKEVQGQALMVLVDGKIAFSRMHR